MLNGLKKYFPRFAKSGSTRRVFALVGAAGTGKSFRARLVAEKYGIELIVDDGLLIRDHQILAGRSAKRENNRFKAVRRAVFDDPDHAVSIKKALKNEKYSAILLLGTSEHMIARITERLGMPYPDKIIYIEDVATIEEIHHARESRRVQGKHVIPVPTVELKKEADHRILDQIRFFMKSHPLLFWKKEVVEKSIVQPPITRRGKISISECALSQMIMHCVEAYDSEIKIRKILIEELPKSYDVEVKLVLTPENPIPQNLMDLQNYVISWIERYSGIHLASLDLTVDALARPNATGET